MMPKPKHKYAAICATLPKLGLDPERSVVLSAAKAEVLAPRREEDAKPLTSAEVNDLLVGIRRRMNLLLTDVKRSVAPRPVPDAGIFMPPQAHELAEAYVAARALDDFAHELTSDSNMLLEVMQILMVDQMEADGVESLSLAVGKAVDTRPEPYAQVVDPARFREWCIANGLGAKMALPWGTANSLLKDRLAAGDPPPDGVDAKSRTVVTMRSTK